MESNRDVTRAFVLLDHAQRDGVAGMLTITSGKWTTYRKMAEVTADKACELLGVQRPCRTHEEVLHAGDGQSHAKLHSLGHRLAAIEEKQAYGKLICECELATYEDIERAIVQGEARTLDDIRREARLGMGPCQGGFCTLRAAGMLHNLRRPPVIEINAALRDFRRNAGKACCRCCGANSCARNA
jgi:glycerol-3-phosphate dehydrogenase